MNSQFRINETAPNFLFDTPWNASQEFYAAIGDKKAVLVFLRYHGCPVCQMEMARLKQEIGLLEARGARLFVFLQSSAETLAPLLIQDDFPFEIVCDPKANIFAQYGVEPGGLIRYLHPAGIVAAVKATVQGFSHKKFEGKETQLPAAFVLDGEKRFSYIYYGRTINDLPPVSDLAEALL